MGSAAKVIIPIATLAAVGIATNGFGLMAAAPTVAGGTAAGTAAGTTFGEAMMLPAAVAEAAPAAAPSLLSSMGAGLSETWAGLGTGGQIGAGILGSNLLGSMMAEQPKQPEYGQLTPGGGPTFGDPATQAVGDVDPYSDENMRRRLAGLSAPTETTLGNTLG